MLSCYPHLLLDFMVLLTFPVDYCLLLKNSLSKDITIPLFLCISYRIIFRDLHFFKLTYFSVKIIGFLFSLPLCNQNSLMLHFHVSAVTASSFFPN